MRTGAHIGRRSQSAASKVTFHSSSSFLPSLSLVRSAIPHPSNQPSKQNSSGFGRKTVNLIARAGRTCDVLEKARGLARQEELFNSACVMAEMIGEKRLTLKVANHLLRDALRANGLWREDRALCEAIIARAYRHVELKILGVDRVQTQGRLRAPSA